VFDSAYVWRLPRQVDEAAPTALGGSNREDDRQTRLAQGSAPRYPLDRIWLGKLTV